MLGRTNRNSHQDKLGFNKLKHRTHNPKSILKFYRTNLEKLFFKSRKFSPKKSPNIILQKLRYGQILIGESICALLRARVTRAWIIRLYDWTLPRLRTQPCTIRLVNDCRVVTPIRRCLMPCKYARKAFFFWCSHWNKFLTFGIT